MKLGKNQRKVISLLKDSQKGVDIKTLGKLLKMQNSEITKIVNPLQNKNVLKNNKVELLFRGEKQRMNMSKVSIRQNFYHELRNSNIFINTIEGIEIQAVSDFYHIFINSVNENNSLNQLKLIKPRLYERMVKGFKENFNFQINELKRKVAAWSEGRYEIIFTDSIFKMISAKTKATILFKPEYRKPLLTEYKELSECIFLLKRTLKELSDSAVSIGTKDYSNF